MYKLTADPSTILNKVTNTFIPKDHRLWADYLEWLTAGNTPEPIHTIEEIRQNQITQIKHAFTEAPSKGLTTSLGLKVDCCREDKDNFQELLDYCVRKNLPGVTIRLYHNDYVDVTPAQLQTIINEIQEYGLSLYQRKWAKEAAIEQATSEEQIKAITWDSVE